MSGWSIKFLNIHAICYLLSIKFANKHAIIRSAICARCPQASFASIPQYFTLNYLKLLPLHRPENKRLINLASFPTFYELAGRQRWFMKQFCKSEVSGSHCRLLRNGVWVTGNEDLEGHAGRSFTSWACQKDGSSH